MYKSSLFDFDYTPGVIEFFKDHIRYLSKRNLVIVYEYVVKVYNLETKELISKEDKDKDGNEELRQITIEKNKSFYDKWNLSYSDSDNYGLYRESYRIHKCTVCSKLYVFAGKRDIYLDDIITKYNPDNLVYVTCENCKREYDPIVDEHKLGRGLTKRMSANGLPSIGGTIESVLKYDSLWELNSLETMLESVDD